MQHAWPGAGDAAHSQDRYLLAFMPVPLLPYVAMEGKGVETGCKLGSSPTGQIRLGLEPVGFQVLGDETEKIGQGIRNWVFATARGILLQPTWGVLTLDRTRGFYLIANYSKLLTLYAVVVSVVGQHWTPV